MKNNRLIIRFTAILLISTALCFVSTFGARYATHYDLGQIAYMLVIFFPITAALIGVMSSIYLRSIWFAPIIALAALLTVMLVSFGSANIIYLLIYMLISAIGYIVCDMVRGMLSRKS